MTFKTILITLSLVVIVSLPVQAGIINTGFLISQENQDADLTMEDVPRNLVNADETITLRWTPAVAGVLRYSTNFMGTDPQNYREVIENPVDDGNGFVEVRGRQLEVGTLHCIIDGGEEGHSAIFIIIRAAENAPVMIGPRSGDGRQGIPTVTPNFSWDAIEGVPFYHLVVSDQEFRITEDEEGAVKVEGANIIWQAITSQTSIMFGIPDPSEFFEFENIPPLVGDTARDDRPRYAWVVLNNYGNHPAYTSTVTGGVTGFEVEVVPPFDDPENITPAAGAEIGQNEILFRWTQVPTASSYFIYISREEITQGGSQALISAWTGQTTFTSMQCPAGDIFQNSRYVWKVVAANQQGRGSISDTTSFLYFVESGSVNFRTRTTNENILQYVEISVEPVEGAALQSFSTDDQGTHQRDIPAGVYRFHANKIGYEEAVSDDIEIESDQNYAVRLQLRPLPSSIVGSVMDQDEDAIAGASVLAHEARSGEEISTETDISGQFQLDVDPGNWNISVSVEGYEPSDEIAVAVLEGRDVDLDAVHGPFTLEEYEFVISGHVNNPAGQPIQLAQVSITNENNETYNTYTPETGTYRFTVGVGDWVMNAQKPGFYLESGNIPVEITNRDLEVNFVLVPQAGIMSGQIFVNRNPGTGRARIWFIPSAGDLTITRSNQIGGYSQGLSPGDYVVTPVLEGYHAEGNLEVNIGPGETISGVRLQLWANPSSIAGRITNTGNEALQGAEVTAAGVTARTDAQGNYRISVSAGQHLVTARKQGYITETEGPVQVAAGQNLTGVNMQLIDNASIITGSVRRGNDPIFDAVVTATRLDNEQSFTTRTDRNGNYSFGLRYGSYRLTVRRDGFVAAAPGFINVQLQPGQEATGRNFAMLNYSARVTGSVRAAGQPVNSPRIRFVQVNNPDREYNTTGNVEGRFILTVAPEVAYYVTATREGFSSARDTTDAMQIEGEVDLEFTINALPCQLQGRVSVNGTPLGQLTVRADGDAGSYQTFTDGSGVYRLNLESGEYHVVASKAGYTQDEQDIRLNPGENRRNVNFEVEENFSIVSGSVTDPDRNPIPDANVTLVDTVMNRSTACVADDDGTFLFDRVLPGAYVLRSQHPRFAAGRLTVGVIVAGQERRMLNVEMLPLNSRITGDIRAGDNPVPTATVYARFDGGEISTQANENGVYTFPNVSHGMYNLIPAKVGYSGIESEQIEITPGDTVEIALEMIRNDGRITGIVIDPDDFGMRGAQITCFDDLGHFASAETRPSGEFLIENLYPLSHYSVAVRLIGYTAEEDTLRDVEPGAAVTFRVTPNQLRLSGRTANQANTPVGSTSIQVTSLADGAQFTTTSGENGNYAINGLARNTRYRLQTHRFEEIYTNADYVFETAVNHIEGENVVLIQSSSSISGNVGVRDVTLQAFNTQIRRTRNIYSSANGTYSFVRLRDGNYVIKASRIGYRIQPDSLVVANLQISEDRGNVNFDTREIRVNISGTVVDPDGELVAGAPVLAWSQVGQFRDTTDLDGAFQLMELYPNQTYSLTTELPAEGYENTSRDVQAGEINVSGVRLEIQRHNAVLTGVVRVSGNPLAGVNVTLDNELQQITSDNGVFIYRFLAGGNHTVTLSKAGYVPQSVVVSTGNGEGQHDYQFDMETLELALYGRITRQDTGDPLQYCVVVATNDLGGQRFDTTGSDGRYNFNRLDPEAVYRLDISKTGFQRRFIENQSVVEGSRELDFELNLVPSAISGNFKHSSGAVIPGARVILQSFNNAISYDTTDFAGDYSFQAVTGNYMLLAVHPNPDEGTSYNHNIALGAGQTLYKTLLLSNAGMIDGRLETEDGDPPASAGYIVSRHEASGTMVFNWSRPDGRFTLRGLRTGDQSLTVEAAGYAMLHGTVSVEIAPRQTTSLTIILTQSGKAITGYVTDQFDDPVERARVSIAGPTPGNLITTEVGYYSLSAPEAGDYTISVSKSGYESPEDTSFTLIAGEIIQVNRVMELLSNAVSGKVSDEYSSVMENIEVQMFLGDEQAGSARTNNFGEYLFEDISPGEYEIKPILEGYNSEPESILITMEPGLSYLDQNFVLTLIRGIGTINGRVIHGADPVAGASITLRDLTSGQRLGRLSDENGEFVFADIVAPANYRLKAIVEGKGEASDSSFRLGMEQEVNRQISFPTGQIRVTAYNLAGNPILNRLIYVSGVNFAYDTTLYTGSDGSVETHDWLFPGTYSVAPGTVPGELPLTPVTVELGRDEIRELVWNLGLSVTPPPSFNFDDSARVEIHIPEGVSVADALLFWKGPGEISWSSRPMQQAGSVLGIPRRSVRAIDPLTGQIESIDQGGIYYGYIPRQTRSGTLLFYLEVRTVDGFLYGGPATVQEIQITNLGMLDHLVVARTMAGLSKLQVGVPIKMMVAAYDDGDRNLTSQLDPNAISWSEADTSRGQLIVNPDNRAEAEYMPGIVGPVRVLVTVSQAISAVTIRESLTWDNERRMLDRISIGPQNLAGVAAGESAMLSAAATDTAGVSMAIMPVWKVQNDSLGFIEPIPYSLNARVHTFPGKIGMQRIAVTDSLTGITGYFNEEEIPDPSQRGLPIYGKIQLGSTDTLTFTDGLGFFIKVPPSSGNGTVKLQKPEMPSVMRITPRYETPKLGYTLIVEGSLTVGAGYTITIPVLEDFNITEPLIGIWDSEYIQWNTASGSFSADSTSVSIIAPRLKGQYALISVSEPLNIGGLRFSPNPFSPYSQRAGLSIEFVLSSDVAEDLMVNIHIYNMAGELIRSLRNSAMMRKGTYSRSSTDSNYQVIWDGLTDSGRMARNGRYVVVMTAEEPGREVRKTGTVVLIK